MGRTLGWLIDGLVVGLLASVAFGSWASAAGFTAAGWTAFFGLLALVLLAYLAYELTRGTSLRAVAIRLDRELGFHDRISSALDFTRSPTPTGFMKAHLEETADFLAEHQQRAVTVPWPRRGRAFGLFLALVLVSFLPHGDRAQLEAGQRRARVEQQRRATRDLANELHQLRQQAELVGLPKLGDVLAQAERALVEELSLVEEEDLPVPDAQEPPPDSKAPVTTGQPDNPDEALKQGIPGATGGVAGQGVRLSKVASYQPVGKFDSFPAQAYAEVFAELDDTIIGDDFLTADELSGLAEHLDQAAGNIGNFGFQMDSNSKPDMGPGPGKKSMSEEDRRDEFRGGLEALQYKAFSEFLKRYAAHLGEKAMGRAHFEQTQKRSSKGGEVVNVSAPPPKDAEFAVTGVSDQANAPLLGGTPEQMAQAAAQAMAKGKVTGANASTDAIKVRGGGTQAGGQGAGVGGGGPRAAAAPKVLPRASGGEYLPLEGKLADGQSVVRLIDAMGHRTLGAKQTAGAKGLNYRDVFVEYAHGAEAELNSEDVPLQMRDFVREYFRSIRPEAN